MLREAKKAFLNSRIDKYSYMGIMFEAHKMLFEYADFYERSDVLDITIKDGNVYFNFLSNGVQIKMVCIPRDVTSVPLTFLDFGAYDMEETKFLLDVVKDNDVVLDVGANLGWYTLNWLKKKKDVTVFSFEPIPEIFDKFVQNLIINGQHAANAFNFGLSNVNGEINFFFDNERCGASSMVNLRGTQNTTQVKCIVKRLDDVFSSLNSDRLDFIKCDVEGAEKLVFDGGIETIKKYKPVIFSEMLRKWSSKFDYTPNDIINMLAKLEYGCYVIHNNYLDLVESVTEDTVETNFIFLNQEKHIEIFNNFPLLPRRLAGLDNDNM